MGNLSIEQSITTIKKNISWNLSCILQNWKLDHVGTNLIGKPEMSFNKILLG